LNIDNNLVENAIRPFAVFGQCGRGKGFGGGLQRNGERQAKQPQRVLVFPISAGETTAGSERLKEFEALLATHRLSPQVIPVPPHS